MKNLALISILIICLNIQSCLNLPISEEIDDFVSSNDEYFEISPVDNSEDEFYIKYPSNEDKERSITDSDESNIMKDAEDGDNKKYIDIKDLVKIMNKRNTQRTREMIHNKQKALWDIGFGKRFSTSLQDFSLEKRGKSKSFMDAIYGKRSSRVSKSKPVQFGRKQHWDLQFGK